jgi:hypothetical protein
MSGGNVSELRNVADDQPDNRYQKAKNALRLILCVRGTNIASHG